jgi:hypothetical protein
MFSAILCQEVLAPPLAEVSENSITGVPYLIGKTKPPDLLDQFCRIAKAEDVADLAGAVVGFAKRWGLLGLCEHGLPNAGCTRHYREDRSTEKHPAWLWWSGRESFEHWKQLALAFRSMLQIGLDMNRGKPGKNQDWQFAILGLSGDLGKKVERRVCAEDFTARKTGEIMQRTSRGLRVGRLDYQTLIQWLIDISPLHPKFQWSGRNKWDVELNSAVGSASNIPAILTSQLLLRIGSSIEQIQCSECYGWFLPRRNQRKYCDDCGIRAAWKTSKRKQRGK